MPRVGYLIKSTNASARFVDGESKRVAKWFQDGLLDYSVAAGGSGVDAAPVESSAEVLKKQQELFATLDQQYEVARAATHTQRGVGLGFSSNHCFPRWPPHTNRVDEHNSHQSMADMLRARYALQSKQKQNNFMCFQKIK